MPNHLPIIDADAHVIETEHTWDYMEPSERKFRPRLFYSPDDETRQYWVIDDKIRGFRARTLSEQQLMELSQRAGRNIGTPQGARARQWRIDMRRQGQRVQGLCVLSRDV